MVYGLNQEGVRGGGHEAFVAAMAAFLRPRLYVEVGVAQGETFKQVAPHCDEARAIDVNDSGRAAVLAAGGQFFLGDSCAVLADWPDGAIELAFLDSSHEYQKTIDECRLLDRKVALNGCIILHDAYPPNEGYTGDGYCGGVWRAVEVIRATLGWEGMTWPAEYGVASFRKHGGRQLQWKT